MEEADPEKSIKEIENNEGNTPYKVICKKKGGCDDEVRIDLEEILEIADFFHG